MKLKKDNFLKIRNFAFINCALFFLLFSVFGCSINPCPTISKETYKNCGGCDPRIIFLSEALRMTKLPENSRTKISDCYYGTLDAKVDSLFNVTTSLNACIDKTIALDDKNNEMLRKVVDKLAKTKITEEEIKKFNNCRYGNKEDSSLEGCKENLEGCNDNFNNCKESNKMLKDACSAKTEMLKESMRNEDLQEDVVEIPGEE